MRIDFQNAILLVLCLVLLLSVFTLSAQAAFENQPISVGTVVDSHRYPNQAYITLKFTSAPSDYYLFTVNRALYAVFSDTGSYTFTLSSTSGLSNTPSYSGTVSLEYNGYYYVELYRISSSYNWNTTFLTNYTSVQSGIDALVQIVGPNVPPEEPISFSYSLPPGNVAYIEMSTQSASAVKLNMDFPTLSNSFGTPFSDANSSYALVESLPTNGSTVVTGNIIPWAKDGKTNIIGQTSKGVFGPIGPVATKYLAVINPAYYGHSVVTGTYYQNPSIDITALNVLGIYVYPLESEVTFNGDTGTIVTTIAGDAYTGILDPETGVIDWTDPDGGNTAPDIGGNNLPEAGNTIFDVLRNIASDFAEFLKGPISAVRVVVSAIRDFMGSFTQLYTWLPSPVYNLITSALMIAITIGVIKIFV